MERTGRSLGAQRVGELDLAATSRLHLLDLGEHVGREHVAADDDQVARSVVHGRLLHHRPDPDNTALVDLRRRIDDAVRADLLAGHPLQTDDAAAGLLAQPGHLVEQRRVAHQLVGQQHGERLVADRRRAHPTA